MHHYNFFIISSYSRDPQTCQAFLRYSFDDQLHFEEILDFQTDQKLINTNIEDVQKILVHTHIALGLSYYKLYPYAQIIVQTTHLTDKQINFWQQFYRSGLGEYCVRNQINPRELIQIKSESNVFFSPLSSVNIAVNRGLVAIGGGKDSIVSAELLKTIDYDFNLISIGKHYPIHHEVAYIIGKPLMYIRRALDPLLFVLNKENGYYNGHIPITGMLAWIKILTAYLYGYHHIILSNEKSANEGNLIRYDIEINHQRSKSLEFEQALNQYMSEFVTDKILYFSLLRGMYEIEIAKLFARRPHYFSTFSSCNNNFKILNNAHMQQTRWCNQCPKCAFVYTILRPWINSTQMTMIRGKELYTDANLIPLYEQLLNISGHKPRECVGTNEEIALSMYQTWLQEPSLHYTPIMKLFVNKILPNLTPKVIANLQDKLYHIDVSDTIPRSLRRDIKQAINQNLKI